MRLKSQSGFTLMELVVTAAFMGIVVVAISSIFIGLRQINRTANSYTIAVQVAQELMEKYRNTPYAGIPVGSTDVTSAVLGVHPSLLAPRSATTTVTEIDPDGLKQIDVAISYTDRTGVRNIQLRTIVSNKGINK